MQKLKLLDLYCCQGGAGMGYSLAGFDVTGIDIEYQKKYPFKFIQDDAVDFLLKNHQNFDFIHASPPCQGYSNLTPKDHIGKYDKMICTLRQMLNEIGKPYVIENVEGAKKHMINPLMLCGSMFGLRTQRHRFFECSFEIYAPQKCDHSQIPLLVTTASRASINLRKKHGMIPKSVKNSILAYGIDWMDFNGLRESIPPAYTKYIGDFYHKNISRYAH